MKQYSEASPEQRVTMNRIIEAEVGRRMTTPGALPHEPHIMAGMFRVVARTVAYFGHFSFRDMMQMLIAADREADELKQVDLSRAALERAQPASEAVN